MGAHEMTWDSQGGTCVDLEGLARGRRHAMPPCPDQEAPEVKYWVATEALAIYIYIYIYYKN